SPHQLRCARACCRRLRSPKVWPRRAARTTAPSAPVSSLLELGVDVVNGVTDRAQVLEILVVDAEADGALPQLLLERLDQLDQRERVGVEVLHEGGPFRDRRGISLQNVGQLVPDQLEHPAPIEGALVRVGLGWHAAQCRCQPREPARLPPLNRSFGQTHNLANSPPAGPAPTAGPLPGCPPRPRRYARRRSGALGAPAF